jgi:hypothetical protein
MANCNARKKEVADNADSAPLSLGSTLNSIRSPSLSHNSGELSRSSNDEHDASVQSIIEKMQTGLEVMEILIDEISNLVVVECNVF